MFEKEAEEYGNEYWDCLVDSDDREMLQEAYKDGAEFGYVVGIEEVLSKLSHHERVKVKALLRYQNDK